MAEAPEQSSTPEPDDAYESPVVDDLDPTDGPAVTVAGPAASATDTTTDA